MNGLAKFDQSDIGIPNGFAIWDGDDLPIPYDEFVEKLLKKQSPEFMKLHVGLGCTGEAGELGDVIKREVIYERDKTSEGKSICEGVVEESGDLLFYLQATLLQYGVTWDEVIQYNFKKLGERYQGLVYSNQAAGDRADKQEQLDLRISQAIQDTQHQGEGE